MNWGEVSAIAASVGLIISLVSIVISTMGARSSNKIAAEALETSRQANNIALGLVREPAVVEFVFSDGDRFKFNFSQHGELNEGLKKIVTLKNVSKRAIDAIAFEIIGIKGLTFNISEPGHEYPVLPSISERLNLRSALQPDGLMHVDMRKYFLDYLQKLAPSLEDKTATYQTSVNVVLAPKAVNDPTPAGATPGLTKDDRRLITISFVPSILDSPEALAVLHNNEVQHRIYD